MEVFVSHGTLLWTQSLSSLRVSAILVGVRGSFFSVSRALTIRMAPITPTTAPTIRKPNRFALASFIPHEIQPAKQEAEPLKDQDQGGIGNNGPSGKVADVAGGGGNFLADLCFRERDLIADQSGRIVSELFEEIDDAGFLVFHGIEEVKTSGGEELRSEGAKDRAAEGTELRASPEKSGVLAFPMSSGRPARCGLLLDALRNLAAAKPTTKSPPNTTSGLRRAYDSRSSRTPASGFSRR